MGLWCIVSVVFLTLCRERSDISQPSQLFLIVTCPIRLCATCIGACSGVISAVAQQGYGAVNHILSPVIPRTHSQSVCCLHRQHTTKFAFACQGRGMSIGFGGFLERLRTEKGLSLRQLGQLADVDHAYVHRLETGAKVDPSVEIVTGLIRALRPGERKARILRFLVGQTVEKDLLDEVLEDEDLSLDDFESAAQMRSRGRPDGREAWRRVLKQIRQIREKMEGG